MKRIKYILTSPPLLLGFGTCAAYTLGLAHFPDVPFLILISVLLEARNL